MRHQHRNWLIALVVVLGSVGLVFMVVEPFLSLPPFWEQLDVGVALTGYGMLMLLSVFVAHRQLWPKKWRLSRKPTGRLQLMRRVVTIAWGIDESDDSGE